MKIFSHPAWKGQRGEWFVVVQVLLFALILLGPRNPAALPAWPPGLAGIAAAAGLLLIAVGGVVCLFAVLHLGANLTPLPHPKDDCQLVVSGLYGVVRHPIYCGVIALAFGWALFVQGWLTLGYALLLAIFLDFKSRREEAWLMQRFAGYAEYRRRVRKLIPFIY